MSSSTNLSPVSLLEDLRPDALVPRTGANDLGRGESKVVNFPTGKSAAAEEVFTLETKELPSAEVVAAPRGSSCLATAASILHFSTPPAAPAPSTPPAAPSQRPQARTKVRPPVCWRNAGIQTQIVYLSRAAAAAANNNERAFAFTLRIEPEILAAQPAPANHMERRLARYMKNALGRPVEFMGVLEWRGRAGNELHIHGAISLAVGEEERVRKALKGAGGAWREGPGSGRQVDLKPMYNADGWARYIAKSLPATRRELKRCRKALPGKTARTPVIHFSSFSLRRRAQSLYERDRGETMAAALTKTAPGGLPSHSRGDLAPS